MQAREWYEKHGITPDADGWFAKLPESKSLPVSNEKWLQNISTNMQRDVPNAIACPYNPRTMVMVCGGVTAKDYLEEIRAKAMSPDFDVFCSNKTGEWLLENGIVPQYHFIIDAKPAKAKDVAKSHPDVTYLIGVNADPGVFETLKDRKVLRFFSPTNLGGESLDLKEAQKYIKEQMLVICGGTMAGVRAFNIADALGYRSLEYYGFDACVASPDKHYTYDKHHNEAILTVRCEDGRDFMSTHIFADQVRQIQEMKVQIPWVKVTVHGDSFMSHMLKLDEAKKKPRAPYRITPAYKAMQQQMHAVGNYGISGHKHAKAIHALMVQLQAKYGSVSVLDYGCGQSTLKTALDKLSPVPNASWREFDECVDGRDSPPERADIVVCSDVMEHIERECTLNVLDHIQELTKKVAFFWIATKDAVKTLPDGRNAHINLRTPDWWFKQINSRFIVGESAVYDGAVCLVGQALEAVKIEAKPPAIEAPARDDVMDAWKDGTRARFVVVNDMTKYRAQTLFVKEPVTIEWIDRMKPGEVLFDIGANVGSYTVWAGKRGLKVHAFEPAAQNYELLCQNIELNNLKNVAAYCAALSDRSRLDTLHLASREPGGSCNEFGDEVGFGLEPRPTPFKQGCVGLRLDELIESGQLPQPDHLKLDVDGFEHLVIQGGSETVKRAKSLVIEVNENLEPHREMVKRLCDMGFSYRQHQVDQARRKSGAFKGCAEYLFYRVNDDLESVIDRIMAAPVIAEPFAHIYVRDVFPKRLYEEMLANLDVEYKKISEVRPVRGYDERAVHSPKSEFWERMDSLLRDGRLKSALCAKLDRYAPSLRDETLLIRDSAGYQIAPHTDSPAKVISALCYLPQDESQPDVGTSLYRPKQKGFTCEGTMHHRFDDFECAKTLPYVPNSLFAFAKTNDSFHGVEEFKGDQRHVLLYDIRSE